MEYSPAPLDAVRASDHRLSIGLTVTMIDLDPRSRVGVDTRINAASMSCATGRCAYAIYNDLVELVLHVVNVQMLHQLIRVDQIHRIVG